MAELKAQVTKASVEKFLEGIKNVYWKVLSELITRSVKKSKAVVK